MKRLLVPASALFAFVALASCDKVQEAKNTYSAVVTTTKAAQEMAENAENVQTKLEARKKSGDTLALPYKELEKYLPASPAGFSAEGGPEGQSTNMTGMHISTATQKYKKDEQQLTVALVDYNSAAPLLMGATAMMNGGLEIENDQELMRGLKFDDPGVKGLETLKKTEHNASVTMSVNDRFLVTIEATGQNDTELVKSVAKDLATAGLQKL